MARKLTVLAAFLLSLAGTSYAAEVRVVLYNNSGVDLTVYLQPDSQESIQILPGEKAEVVLPETPWIDFGMMAHRYETLRVRATDFVQENVVKVQAEADGCLYLVAPKTDFPASPLPKQPSGFPLAPIEKTDLA